MTDQGTAEVLRDLATAATEQPEPIELVPGHLHGIVLQPGQTVHPIDVEKYNQIPHRKTGSVKHRDVESFAQYVNRHRQPDGTTLWANAVGGTVTAVLNDHEQIRDDQPEITTTAFAGWGDHRATLTVEHTPDWLRWLAGDGKLVDQATFAEHLEDLAHTIIRPHAAEMVELAQHFQAARNVDFESARRLDSGEVQLMYRETIGATAGKRGELAIPDQIFIAVEPFAGSERVELTARFRYRLAESAVKLGYRLVRPDKARDEAFAALLDDLSTRVELDVMHGTPRG